MGEEPERLRALHEALLKEYAHLLPPSASGYQAAEWTLAHKSLTVSAALLAEVERLARDNENIEEVYKRQLAEVVVDRARYRAEVEESEREVERLAGERDKAYRATGEYALRAKKAEAECERLAGERDKWERRADEIHQDWERLAGRVATLETVADKAQAWVRVYDGQTTTHIEWRNAMQSLRIALADVGGSEWIEDAPPKGNDAIGI